MVGVQPIRRLREGWRWEQVAVPGEDALWSAILRDDRVCAEGLNPTSPSPNHDTAWTIDPNWFPTPWQIAHSIADGLHWSGGLELALLSDPLPSVTSFSDEPRRLRLFLSTGLLEQFSERELRFALGRLFASVIAPSRRLPPDAPVEIDRALGRFALLSADRLGLLCCQDLPAALRAAFKLTTGLSEASLRAAGFPPDFWRRSSPVPLAELAFLAADPAEFLQLRLSQLIEWGESAESHSLLEPCSDTTHATWFDLVEAPDIGTEERIVRHTTFVRDDCAGPAFPVDPSKPKVAIPNEILGVEDLVVGLAVGWLFAVIARDMGAAWSDLDPLLGKATRERIQDTWALEGPEGLWLDLTSASALPAPDPTHRLEVIRSEWAKAFPKIPLRADTWPELARLITSGGNGHA